MTRHRCPHCNRFYNIMPNTGDYVHDCDSGNDALDYEDIVNISGNNWNLQGLGQGLNLTVRGNNANTTRIVKHEEYIK